MWAGISGTKCLSRYLTPFSFNHLYVQSFGTRAAQPILMEATLPTLELAISAPGQCTLHGETVPQADEFGVVRRARRQTALSEAKVIARAELARQRKRLGTLTREQEVEVEKVLMSTVTKVSELTGRIMDSLPM
jgi:hypothetical protein